MKNDLKQYRADLFRSCEKFNNVERIPYFSSAVTWKIFDAGYTIKDAMTNFDVMEKCVRHFLDNYRVDAMLDIGIRNQFNVTEAFSDKSYYYYTEDSVGIHDHAHCTPDTLMEYLDNPEKYTWEKILPDKFGDEWSKKELSVFKNTFSEYMKYTKFIIHMGSVTGKEYSLPSLAPNNPMKGAIVFGIEELMANLLGIKQLSVAMRRNESLISEFVEKWDAKYIDPIIDGLKGPNPKYCFDSSIIMLSHNILSPKQFEKFFYPSLKRLLDGYMKNNMSVRIFTEGSILRYAEYFQDYPKGLLTFHLEQDDPFEVRKVLPNVAIMGGITSDLLANGTIEECITQAKRLRDELGIGFIFSENKMLSYRNDAKSENLKAVTEFAAGGNDE